MSGLKASLAISFAVVLDLLKLLFNTFIFTAPFFVAAGAVVASNQSSWTRWLPDAAVGAAAGGLVAGLELFGAPIIATAIYAMGALLAFFTSLTGWLVFCAWFFLSGIFMSMRPARIFGKMAAGAIGSLIPFVNILPTFTPVIASIVFDVRRKDAEKRKTWLKKKKEAEEEQMRAMGERALFARATQEETVVEAESEAMAAENEAVASAEANEAVARKEEEERMAREESFLDPQKRGPLVGAPVYGPRTNDERYGGKIPDTSRVAA